MNVRLRDGFLTDEFEAGIEEFVDFAQRHPELMDGTKIRCPCNDRKCQNRSFQELDIVRFHLAKNGFVRDYYLDDQEYHAAHTYILLNCEKVKPYIE